MFLCSKKFEQLARRYSLPEKFPNPFYFRVHPLAELAVKELQEYIEQQVEWNFGIHPHNQAEGHGKMFGVLVVQNKEGKIGYLAAFSGKLFHTNNHPRFVPPIFDMLEENAQEESFYQVGERRLYAMSDRIMQLETDPKHTTLDQQLEIVTKNYTLQQNELKKRHDHAKLKRDQLRSTIATLSIEEQQQLNEQLNKESVRAHFERKNLKQTYRQQCDQLTEQIVALKTEIANLKQQRKHFSNELQNKLFDHYSFLNARGEQKSVLELFKNAYNGKPPAGAGECCAPKLLQYAYQHNLKPIALAEFWWGKSPQSEIRHHKQLYPACKGKCLPILTHMLEGIEVEENPLQHTCNTDTTLHVLYEDSHLLAVNKNAEMLSVPGKTLLPSVFDLVNDYLPKTPWMVHRLDMSTSGILLIAKNKESYVNLQRQFAQKTIKKRYIAILDGLLPQTQGTISLPLRVDLDDRPRQLVCFQHGRPAHTKWETIEERDGKTKVYFHPITGRTHQLRIHASHQQGLNTPIVGDNLYGKHAERLFLHAEQLIFEHPQTKKIITLHAEAPF